MPYRSASQQAFFNAHRKEIGGKVVDEFNKASKGMKLPEHVKVMREATKGNPKRVGEK